MVTPTVSDAKFRPMRRWREKNISPALRRIIFENGPYGLFIFVGGDINTAKEFL